MPRILSVAAVAAPHRYSQAQIKATYASLRTRTPKRYLSIFEHAGVEFRHFTQPLPYYRQERPFGERNNDFLRAALELGQRAVAECATGGATPLEEIRHLISTTTTGLATPSLEARIAEALGLPREMKRTPIFGTGCASGAVGLSRAAEYLRANPQEKALLVSVELCSLTFQNGDSSVRNLVASALFADGAAAALLAGDEALGCGPAVVANASHLFPDSMHMMGWDFSERGMGLLLSTQVPRLVRRSFRALIEGFLGRHGLRLKDIRYWLLHPGGLKVIEAYEAALGLKPHDTRLTRWVLSRYGNLSSASVIFILKRLLDSEKPPAGSYGLLAALGPGFAAEMVLLRW